MSDLKEQDQFQIKIQDENHNENLKLSFIEEENIEKEVFDNHSQKHNDSSIIQSNQDDSSITQNKEVKENKFSFISDSNNVSMISNSGQNSNQVNGGTLKNQGHVQVQKKSSGILSQSELFQLTKQEIKLVSKSSISTKKNIQKKKKTGETKQLTQLKNLLKIYDIIQDQDIQNCWQLLKQKKIDEILKDYFDDQVRKQVQQELIKILKSMFPKYFASSSVIIEKEQISLEQKLLEEQFKNYKIDQKSFPDCLKLYKDKNYEKLYQKVKLVNKARQKFKNQIQKIFRRFNSFIQIPKFSQIELIQMQKNVKKKFLEQLKFILNKIQKIKYRQCAKIQILSKKPESVDLQFLIDDYSQEKKQIQNLIQKSKTIIKIKFQDKDKGQIKLDYFMRDKTLQEQFDRILYSQFIQREKYLIYKNGSENPPIQFNQILGQNDEMEIEFYLQCFPKQDYLYNFLDKENQAVTLSNKLSNSRIKNIIKKDILLKYKGQIKEIIVRYQRQDKNIDLDESNTLFSIKTNQKFFFKPSLTVFVFVDINIYYGQKMIKIQTNLSQQLYMLKVNLQIEIGIPPQSQYLFRLINQNKQEKLLQDNEIIGKFCDQNLNFGLILQNCSIKQFYGFNKNISQNFQYFCKFFIENEEQKRQFFQKFTTQSSQKDFFQFLLNFLYSGMKKKFPISLIIQNIKKQIIQKKVLIWQAKYDKKRKFNQQFVLNYLLKNAEPKLRVQIMKLVQQYLPIPLYLKEFSSITKVQQDSMTLLEEFIWIIKKGFTISSVGLHKKIQRQGTLQLGKSYLLNKVFNLNFMETDRKHKISKNIPHIRHRIYQNIFPLNVIDIPKQCKQQIKQSIFKSSNIILVHSWKDQAQTKKQIEKLSQKYKVCVICLLRDKTNQELTQVSLCNKSMRSIINIKNQQNCQAWIQRLKLQIHQAIKVESKRQMENQNMLLKMYQKSQSKLILDKIFQLMQCIKKNPYNCCPLNKLQKQIEILQNKSRNRSKQDDEKIKKLQNQIKNQGLSEQIHKIMSFYNNTKDNKYSDLAQMIIRQEIKTIQRQKTEQLLKIYSYRDQYKQIISKENIEKIYFKKQLHKKMKNIQIVYPFQDQDIISLKEQDSHIWFKQMISKIQNQIKPSIFSTELLSRQIFGLIKKNFQVKFQENSLMELLVKFKKSQVMRNLPFQLIDGDLLEMPRLLMNQVFKNSNEKCAFITILGPQSSGKSTLLNKLFGCDFATSQGRCTKGVYGTYYPFAFNYKASQIFSNFQGIFVIDTQGLFSVSNQFDQQSQKSKNYNINEKKRNFDAKLVVFCLAISDFIIINVKNNIDASTYKILKLCKQKLQKLNIPQEREPTVAIILNQAISSNIQQSQRQFQKVYQILKFKIKKSLQFAYEIKNLGCKDVSLFLEGQGLIKKIPKKQFLTETSKLLTQMMQQIKKIKQILPITQKIKICERIWSDILQFPDLSCIKSEEQLKRQAQIKSWTNDIQKKRDQQIFQIEIQFKKKRQEKKEKNIEALITEIIKEQKQKCKKQQMQFDLKFCQDIQKYTFEIKKITQNQKENFNYRNLSWLNELQYILNKKFYQEYLKTLKFESDQQLNQQCFKIKEQINKGKIYSQIELKERFNLIFQKFINLLKAKLINLEQQQFSFKKNKQDFNYLIKSSSSYGLPDQNKINVEYFNNFLKSKEVNNQKNFQEMLLKQLIQPIIKQFDYCLQSTQSKAYTNSLVPGKTDSKKIYFDMSEYFQQKQVKHILALKKQSILSALNKKKIIQILQNHNTNNFQQQLTNIIFNLINSQLKNGNASVQMRDSQNFYKAYKRQNSFFKNNWFAYEDNRIELKIIQQNLTLNKKQLKSSYLKFPLKFDQFTKNHYLKHLQQKFHELLNWSQIKKQIQKMKTKDKQYKKKLNQSITLQVNSQLKNLNLIIKKEVDWLEWNYENMSNNNNYQYQLRNNQLQIQLQIGPIVTFFDKLPKFKNIMEFYHTLCNFQFFSYQGLKEKVEIKKYQQFQAQNQLFLAVGLIKSRDLQPIVQKKNLQHYSSSNINLTSPKLRSRDFKQFVFQELLTGVSKKSSKIMIQEQKDNNSFYKFIKKCLQTIDAKFATSNNIISKNMLIQIVQKVTKQLVDFDADLNQVSLKLTSKFKGYSYYLVSCYVWFLAKHNKQISNLKLIEEKIKQKQVDQVYFLNNISNDQNKMSTNDTLNFLNSIVQFINNQYWLIIQKLKKKANGRKNQKQYIDKFKRKNIQEKLDKQILKKQNKNKYQEQLALQYIKDPAKYIKKTYSNLIEQEMININQQLKKQISNIIEKKGNFIETLSQVIQSFSSQFFVLSKQQTKFVQFFQTDKKEKLLIDKNKLFSYQIKNIWTRYFLNKLIKQQVQYKFGPQKIKQKFPINIDLNVQISEKLIECLANMRSGMYFKISNLFCFLKIIRQPQWKMNLLNKVRENLKPKQNDIKAIKQIFSVIICQQKCPCCNRICGQEGPHKIHKVIFGHQFRAFNGTYIEYNKKKIASVLRCEQIAEMDMVLFNGNMQSWTAFKDYWKKKDPGSWSFQDLPLTKNLYQDVFSKAWQDLGKKVCQQQKMQYVPPNYTYEKQKKSQQDMHLIFALDQSGSMSGEPWKQLINALTKIIDSLKSYDHVSVSIIKFGITANIVFKNQAPSKIQMSKITFIGTDDTKFEPPFKEAYFIANMHIKNKTTVFVFMTDGLSTFPNEGVKLFKQVMTAHPNKFIYRSIHLTKKTQKKQSSVLNQIAKQLNGKNVQVFNPKQLQITYKNVMCQVIKDQKN